MDGHSPLEMLSTELYTIIITHITSQRDLNCLSQTSRSLYHRTVPELYRSWSYHGLARNPKDVRPLKKFLTTINWRPDLAVHVKELDVREWGDCPRLEEYVGCFWEGHDEREEVLKMKRIEEMKGTVGEDGGFWEMDEGDEEFVCDSEDEGSTEGGEDVDMNSDSDGEYEEYEPVEESELACLEHTKPDRDEKVDAMFLRAARDMEFENPEMILNYAEILFEDNDEKLVIKLLCSLPNLQTLRMVMPEDWAWHPEEIIIHKFLDDTAGLASLGVLQQLESVYLCSAMHLGGKDHREYTLDMKRVFPLMRLPSLRNLYILTGHCLDDTMNFPPIDYSSLKQTSNLTTLVYDEADIPPDDVMSMLSIPNALKEFRWTGVFQCFSIGTCYAPFQASLGAALEAHKGSLEDLYLDIRHINCNGDGHYGNPFTTLDSVRRIYSAQMADEWASSLGPKNAIMIGSLLDFKSLKKLAIDVTSLIGHQNWAASPIPLVDALPSKLISLTLFINVSRRPPNPELVFDNQLFYAELLNLLRPAPRKLHRLENIKLRLIFRKGSTGNIWSTEVGDTPFKEVEGLCMERGISFEVAVASQNGETEIPYFLEQTSVRNPGRDF